MKRKHFYFLLVGSLLSVIFMTNNAVGQEVIKITLSPSVVDIGGNPVADAVINIEGVRRNFITDEEGKFSLEALPSDIIVIEAEGFETFRTIASDLAQEQTVTLIKMPFHMGKKDEIYIPFGKITRRQAIAPVYALDIDELEKTDSKQGVLEAVRGRVPGVYGTNSIRGLGNAMIVIDGFPRATSGKGSNFNLSDYIDLQEIEQITVLKDAASRMLYGTEADNGVILITTKRGEAYKSKLGLRVESGLKNPVSFPNYLDAADYMTMYNLAATNDGGVARFSDEQIENTRLGTDKVRYPDESFYNSTYLNNLSDFFRISADASGGNDQARYYSKVSWANSGNLYAMEQEGKSFKNNEFTFRGNVDYNVTDWLKSSLDAFFMLGADRQPIRDFWWDAASHLPNSYPMLIPLSMIGDTTLEEKAKVFDGSVLGGTNQYTNNIYGNFVLGGFRTFTTRAAQISTGFDFDLGMITQGLSAQVKLNYDVLNSYILSYSHDYAVYERSYVPAVSYSGDSLKVTKIGVDERTQTQGLSSSRAERRLGVFSTINYNRIFDDKHSVSAVASGYWSYYDIMARLYSYRYNTFGLRANYMFDRRLIAEFTGIFAGSGYLPEDNRYRFAPSAGIGYILSEEGFLAGNSFVNYLKVKANFGTVLTDAGFPGYRLYSSTFASSGSFTYNQNINQNSGRVFSNLGNPGINLISRNDLNVGLETMLAGNRIWIEGNYFQSVQSGVITQRQDAYPVYIPVLQYENYEKYSDKGFDLELNIRERVGDFRFSIGGNLVHVIPKAELVEEPEYVDAPYRQLQGQPYDAIFGYEALGLFQSQDEIDAHPSQAALGTVMPGDIKYNDLNGDSIIDQNDLKIIGYSRARLGYGINLSLGYKNFTLYALGTGQGGSSRTFRDDYYWQVGQTVKYSDVVLDSWTPETAATATYPTLHLNSADNNHRTSTYWIEKNNWFVLHTVQLTYQMNPGFGKDLQVYLRGHNLVTVSPIKEKLELNTNSLPQMRTYALGINVLF